MYFPSVWNDIKNIIWRLVLVGWTCRADCWWLFSNHQCARRLTGSSVSSILVISYCCAGPFGSKRDLRFFSITIFNWYVWFIGRIQSLRVIARPPPVEKYQSKRNRMWSEHLHHKKCSHEITGKRWLRLNQYLFSAGFASARRLILSLWCEKPNYLTDIVLKIISQSTLHLSPLRSVSAVWSWGVRCPHHQFGSLNHSVEHCTNKLPNNVITKWVNGEKGAGPTVVDICCACVWSYQKHK